MRASIFKENILTNLKHFCSMSPSEHNLQRRRRTFLHTYQYVPLFKQDGCCCTYHSSARVVLERVQNTHNASNV